MNLIFMGTPEFSVPSLCKLIEAGHHIQAVFTQPDKPVGRKQAITPPPIKVCALEHGLTVYQPLKIKTAEARAEFEPVFEQADAGIVAAYGRILPDWMLNAPRLGCINVHSSILPKYRGAAPINWAIANGEKETGVTIMQMDVGMDTGNILQIRKTSIGVEETAAELTPRLAEIGATLLVDTLAKLERGEITSQRQDASMATYAPMLKKEDGQIDWSMAAYQISKRRRGFTPFPGCYTTLNGQKLEIIGATPWQNNLIDPSTFPEPGTICFIGKDCFCVACAIPTTLQIKTVQPAGKKVMSARDFLNGAKIQVGTKLG